MRPFFLALLSSRTRQEILLSLTGLLLLLCHAYAKLPGGVPLFALLFTGLHLLTAVPFFRRLRPGFFAARFAFSLLLFAHFFRFEQDASLLAPLLGFTLLTSFENLLYQGIPAHQTLLFSPVQQSLNTSPYTRFLKVGYLLQSAFVAALLLSAPASWLGGILLLTFVSFLSARLLLSSSLKRFRAEVLAALHKYDPQFCLYFSAPPNTLYHVQMWYEYLRQLEGRMMILTRKQSYYHQMSECFDVPILHVQHMSDLDAILTPQLRAAFYVNNSTQNTQMIIHRQLCHIQLLHGDSDKASSYNPTTSIFDKIFVAGQLGIDRYKNNGVLIPEEKFEIVGRPQLAEIERASERTSPRTGRPTLLYAPTWRGVSSAAAYSSVDIAEELLQSILARNEYRLLIKLHPYTNKDPIFREIVPRLRALLEKFSQEQQVEHVLLDVTNPSLSLFECFNQSDALISDISSVVSDYLYSEKPFCLIDRMNHGEEMVKHFPTARVAYRLDASLSQLDACLEELFVRDSKKQERLEFRKYALGDFSEKKYSDRFRKVAHALIHRSPPEQPLAPPSTAP